MKFVYSELENILRNCRESIYDAMIDININAIVL